MSSLKNLGARAGIAGPILFAGVFLVEGWLRPGYNPISQYVSELSLGPRGFIQIASFILFSILFSLFALALHRELRSRGLSAVSPMILVGIGLALFIAGVCVMDPITTPWAQATAPGMTHVLAGVAVFSGWPVALGLMAIAVRRDDRWRAFVAPTLVAALVTAVAFGVMVSTLPPPGGLPWAYAGLAQRAHLLTWLTWTVFAARRIANG